MTAKEFTHFNPEGRAKMVDLSEKNESARWAVAQAIVMMNPETLKKIEEGSIAKGDVLAVAQVAGIMAAKKVPELIPMCHPLELTGVDINFEPTYPENEKAVLKIKSTVKNVGRTGVEMEAVTAASIAALTVYDMCKAVDRWMRITEVSLIEKAGGKSGHIVNPEIE